jgi:GTP-binding protein
MTSAVAREQFPRDGLPEVAFVGRSNVGKSSLLNALAGTKGLARVSKTPGRTRLVNFFKVLPERSRHPLYLVDLPGYGYAKASDTERRSWEAMASSYLLDRAPLALCVVLLDIRHEPQEGDLLLHAWITHHRLPFLIAATKADKLGRGDLLRRRDALARGIGQQARQVLTVSAQTGDGVPELWKALREAAAV